MDNTYIHDDYHPSLDDDWEPCTHRDWAWSDYWQGYVCENCGQVDHVVSECDVYGHSWQADSDGAYRCIRCGDEQF